MDLEKIPVAIGDMNDVKGLKASAALIHSQIDNAVAKGTASTDIVIGGFSQGGAMALYAGYTYPKTLAGVVVFSGWAPLQAADEATFMGDVKAGANANTPAFIAHGTRSTPNLSASAASAASAAAEPAGHPRLEASSRRPHACARRPSGPQSRAAAAWAPQAQPWSLSEGAAQDTGFAARTGTQDEVVLPSCGERAEACLKEAGVTDVSFATFGMAHATHPAQMKALKSWLEEKLPLA